MTGSTLHPSFLARLFADGVGKQPLAEIGPGALTIYGKSATQRLLHNQIDGVREEQGIFWSTLIVQPRTGAIGVRCCPPFRTPIWSGGRKRSPRIKR